MENCSMLENASDIGTIGTESPSNASAIDSLSTDTIQVNLGRFPLDTDQGTWCFFSLVLQESNE